MKLADATDPRFTDDQRAQLARFEAARIPAEVLLAHLEIDEERGVEPTNSAYRPNGCGQ